MDQLLFCLLQKIHSTNIQHHYQESHTDGATWPYQQQPAGSKGQLVEHNTQQQQRVQGQRSQSIEGHQQIREGNGQFKNQVQLTQGGGQHRGHHLEGQVQLQESDRNQRSSFKGQEEEGHLKGQQLLASRQESVKRLLDAYRLLAPVHIGGPDTTNLEGQPQQPPHQLMMGSEAVGGTRQIPVSKHDHQKYKYT